LKLREKPHSRRDRPLSREFVAPVPFKPRSDLGVGQATPEVCLKYRDDVIGLLSVWLVWIHDIAALQVSGITF
jgi:hypothetical protein